MSRTDTHAPFRVRIARGDLTAFAAHDHTAGSCDLPPRNHIDHSMLHQTACRWEWVYDGTNVCSCQLCHEGKAHRRQRRRTRHMVREALHTAAIRWNSSVADAPIRRRLAAENC